MAQPQLGVAKAIVGDPANNGDGTYTLTYRIRLENSGGESLDGVQVVDELVTTFAAAASFSVVSVHSSDFTVNSGFDGSSDPNVLAGSDSLAAGASGRVEVTVTVTPGGNLGPYDNSAIGSATGAGGTPVTDVSTAGSDPDANGNGDPGDDSAPTSVSLSESPEIGVAKDVVARPTNNNDGTYTFTYRIRVENSGDVPVLGVQVTDHLETTFDEATGFVVNTITATGLASNPTYNGKTNTHLLLGTDLLPTGASGSIDLQVTVTPGANLGPYTNSATGSATSVGGAPVTDVST